MVDSASSDSEGVSKLRFGLFSFDPTTGILQRAGVEVPLQRQPARVLAALLDKAGEVVSRQDLSSAIWEEGTHVDFERGLNFCISQLRSALQDDAAQPLYIRTIPKQGYQFIAPFTRTAIIPEAENKFPQSASPLERPVRSSTLPVAAALFLLVSMAGLGLLRHLRRTRAVLHSPIVAILRFDNETGDPSLDRFGDTLTDDVITRLAASGAEKYKIIGNSEVLRVPREQRNLTDIATALHANYVILGQVQTVGSGTRVLAHLIRMPDQTHVWVVRRESARSDVRDAESAAAAAIAEEFSLRIVPTQPSGS